MTNAIEQTRRVMYDHLESVKASVTGISTPTIYVKRFEEFLEAHLEELRKEISHGKAHAKEIAVERDRFRNKLQAFEFANRSAAELLSEALMEPSGLRKSVGSTSGQNKEESRLCATCGGFGKALCMHSFFAIGDDQMKCTFCGVVK